MTVKALRERKAAKTNEARALLAKAEGEKRSLTAEESAAFDALRGEIESLETQEARAQFLDDAERRQAGTVVHGDRSGDLEQRVSLLDVIRSRMEGRALTGAAAEYHAETERRTGRRAQGVFVPLSALEQRAPNTTATAASLVGTDHRGDAYIGPLRDSLLVRQMGVRVLSGLTGDVTVPKAGDGLTAAWVDENEAIPESSMTFSSITLSPKHVGALTEMSRQLIQQSDPSIEQLVRDDLAYAVAAEVDRAIIAGDGVKEPLGIINRAGVQTATLPASWADVLAMVQLLNAINVNPSAWYTTPDVMSGLRGTLKEAGLAGYIAEGGRIADVPAYVSNAAPAATAILGDFSQIILGVWGELDILINPYESTAYRRGGVMVRAMATMDVGVRYEQAFVVASTP